MTFIFFLIFSVVIFGVMLLLSFVRGIGSMFGRSPSFGGFSSNHNTSSDRSGYNTSKSNKKVFSKDEGEYIKYEEVED